MNLDHLPHLNGCGSASAQRMLPPENSRRGRWVPGAAGLVAAVAALTAAGCRGAQSSLDPAGRGAERIAELFWWMSGGAVVIWIGVAWLAWSAIRGRASGFDARRARWYIIGGGAVLPTVVLTGLLVYGLGMMPELLQPAPPGSLRVTVVGEQWWWRVHYHLPDGRTVTTANEVRLPVDRAVEFLLESPDVIHAFWIPALGGKMDMIPGRQTRLLLHPTRTGTFRGVCAEYCGDSHALMAFSVVVMAEPEFAAWLAVQEQPAESPVAGALARGRDAFFANGCGACHTIRGTEAAGVIGPDLTHVGGRLSLGAGILPNDPEAMRRWIEATDQVKPGVLMPHFGMLPPGELEALAAYLHALR